MGLINGTCGCFHCNVGGPQPSRHTCMQRSPTQQEHTAHMFHLLCSAAAVLTADRTAARPINAAGTLTFDTLPVTLLLKLLHRNRPKKLKHGLYS